MRCLLILPYIVLVTVVFQVVVIMIYMNHNISYINNNINNVLYHSGLSKSNVQLKTRINYSVTNLVHENSYRRRYNYCQQQALRLPNPMSLAAIEKIDKAGLDYHRELLLPMYQYNPRQAAISSLIFSLLLPDGSWRIYSHMYVTDLGSLKQN